MLISPALYCLKQFRWPNVDEMQKSHIPSLPVCSCLESVALLAINCSFLAATYNEWFHWLFLFINTSCLAMPEGIWRNMCRCFYHMVFLKADDALSCKSGAGQAQWAHSKSSKVKWGSNLPTKEEFISLSLLTNDLLCTWVN